MKKGISLPLSVLIVLIVFASPLSALRTHQSNNGTDFIFFDLLYWNLRDGSSENWAQEISPEGTNRTAKLLSIPFKCSPGFRLGLRHTAGDGSCWDAILSYTGFQTKGISQAAASSGGIYSPFLGNFFINNRDGSGISGPIYHNAGIHWKVAFNVVDAELGHNFEIAPCFMLRPFIGLKAAFINHDIRSTWQNPIVATTFNSATENLKNDFWGIGPSIGLNTRWAMYQNEKNSFNIIADATGSLLLGNWRFKDLYTNNTPASVAVHLRSITGATSMTRGLLGIEWVGCIAGANIGLRLGYELQVWFNQVQYYSFNMGRLSNLMSLQGGVLGFNVNF